MLYLQKACTIYTSFWRWILTGFHLLLHPALHHLADFIRPLLLRLKIGAHLYLDDDADGHQLYARNDQHQPKDEQRLTPDVLPQ